MELSALVECAVPAGREQSKETIGGKAGSGVVSTGMDDASSPLGWRLLRDRDRLFESPAVRESRAPMVGHGPLLTWGQTLGSMVRRDGEWLGRGAWIAPAFRIV